MKIVMIGIRHNVDDDRIYHKEALSLKFLEDEIVVVAQPAISRRPLNVKVVELEGNIVSRIFKAILYGIKENGDIYHVHDMESLLAGVIIKVIRPKAKLIWDVHEYYPDMIPLSNIWGKLFLFLMCFVMEPILSKTIIYSILTADLDTAYRYMKWNNRTFVIHNYAEFSRRDKSSFYSYNALSALGTLNSLTPPILVYIGGISKDRGAEFLLTLANIFKKNGLASIVMAGPLLDEVSKKLVTYDNVIYLGQLTHEDIPLILRRSHIGLILLQEIPKYKKNLPIKLFEYISFGLPVISSILDATCRYINADNTGICVRYGDVNGVLKAVFNILLKYPEYKRNCLKASLKYTWRYERNKFLKIYKTIMGVAR